MEKPIIRERFYGETGNPVDDVTSIVWDAHVKDGNTRMFVLFTIENKGIINHLEKTLLSNLVGKANISNILTTESEEHEMGEGGPYFVYIVV